MWHENLNGELSSQGEVAASLRSGASKTYQFVSTSSAVGVRVKTSASPGSVRDSPAHDPASSSSSHGAPMSLFGQEDGCSLRTSPGCSIPSLDEISPSWSARWATSGFTTSPGECWTADTSECPSDGDASSSLADVLLETVPDRFYLSPRAAAGILRRAEKRGRELPRALAEALSDLASAHPDDGRRMMRTSSPPRSVSATEATTSTALGLSSPTVSHLRSRDESVRASTQTEPGCPSSLTLFALGDSTPARTEPGEEPRSSQIPCGATPGREATATAHSFAENQRGELLENETTGALKKGGGKPGQGYPAIRTGSTVRRLTPTECERLQGFPDGWTIPSPTARATHRWETP